MSSPTTVTPTSPVCADGDSDAPADSDVPTESAPPDSSLADPDSAEDSVGFVLEAIDLVFPSLSQNARTGFNFQGHEGFWGWNCLGYFGILGTGKRV